VPGMLRRKSRSIVSISTFVSYTVGMPHMAGGAASKSDLIGFTPALAAARAARRLPVNALLTGGTNGPMS